MKGSQSRLPFFVVGFSKEYDGLPLVSWTCQLDFLFLYSPPQKKSFVLAQLCCLTCATETLQCNYLSTFIG